MADQGQGQYPADNSQWQQEGYYEGDEYAAADPNAAYDQQGYTQAVPAADYHQGHGAYDQGAYDQDDYNQGAYNQQYAQHDQQQYNYQQYDDQNAAAQTARYAADPNQSAQYDQYYYDQNAEYQQYDQDAGAQYQQPPPDQSQGQAQGQIPGASTPSADASRKSGSSSSRIDPRQIPRPSSQRRVAPIVFETDGSTNPPEATSEFISVDKGNCSPRYIRLTSYQIPVSEELVESTRLSVGAVIHPLATPGDGEAPVPVVDMGEGGPIRCGRCHAYLNPFFTFSEDGQRFTCNCCGMSSPVPHWYVCNVDANGVRRDRDQRPELHLGSVEYIAPADYSTRPAQEPCYVFVVDVSYTSIVTGLLETTIRSIRSCIDVMSEYPRVRMGIITYHSVVHVYNFKASSKTAGMMIVADVDDVFVPVPVDEILVHPSDPDSRAALQKLLDSLFELHGSNKETISAFGAAVHVGVEAMSDCGGKLLVVQSALPRKGLGSLEDRDDSSLYGTDKERSLYLPQDSFYQVEATTCAEKFISVDLFVCANSYIDLATVGVLSTMTGGQIYYYPNFKVGKDGYALECDIMQTLTRETGFEGIMAVRTSAGLKVAEYFGNFFRRHSTEVEVPAIDCDKSFAVRIEHEDRLDEKKNVCIQCALLYTNFDGERRIRVHTISIPTTSSMANIFRHADLSAVVNLSLKQASCHAIDAGVSSARTSLRQAVIDVLFIYRKRCASASSSGQLILPESLKLLPVYTLGMMKSIMLADGSNPDDRVFHLHLCKTLPAHLSIPYCMPRLYSLHDMADDVCIFDEEGLMHLPELHIVSSEFLDTDGIYLLDNGRVIFVWIGDQVSPDIIHELVGVSNLEQCDVDDIQVYPNEDPQHIATRVSSLIEYLRRSRPTFNCARIVYPRSKNSAEFDKLLIENTVSPPQGSSTASTACEFMSYVDFLCHIHRAIQDRMLS